ncbi:MAG: hypothetical protein PHR77_20765, partial [Kiritimatiellae bacterium]|nr:hypothetical protein [Kiritimatiellia bacterium]
SISADINDYIIYFGQHVLGQLDNALEEERIRKIPNQPSERTRLSRAARETSTLNGFVERAEYKTRFDSVLHL